MTKVYVSSTRLDLEPERAAVIDWLTRADHQPVHSYVADTKTVRQGCLQDVCECNAYVLILGFRYGHVPEDDNPDRLSITELEYRQALAAHLPIVVLAAKGARDVELTDIGKPEYAKVEAFARLVNRNHKAYQFSDEADLIAGLSSALPKGLRSDPLQDSNVQSKIGKLYLDSAKKDDLLVTQSVAVLHAQCLEAVNRILTAGKEPDATAEEQAAAQALLKGDTKPAEALLRLRQNEVELRVQAAPDETAARVDRRRAAQLARERGALLVATEPAGCLSAYEEAAEYEPDDRSAWTSLMHLYIAKQQFDDAQRAFKRAAEVEHLRADLPVKMMEVLRAYR